MAVSYNTSPASTISYNTSSVSTGTYNGTTVFNGSGAVVILASATLQTDVSQVPPPYDEQGYNYNATAPKKEADLSISLGDITSYSSISFDFTNDGSFNGYGYIRGTATINNTTIVIFDSINQTGTRIIDTSDLSGEYALRIHIEAKSNSSYRGYTTKAILNMTNICGNTGSVTPPVTNVFSIDSGTSQVPPPYDAQGYNYGGTAPAKSESYELELGDVTSKSSLTFTWYNYDGDNHSGNGYGTIYGGYYDLDGIYQYLFNTPGDTTGSVTIDLTSATGLKTIRFTVYAKSLSSYKNYTSNAVLKVSEYTLT